MNQDGARHKRTSRRQVLVAGGAAVAVVGAGGVLASNALGEESPAKAKPKAPEGGAGETCYRLSTEAIEGPYYIDVDQIRSDVTEGKEGVPLTLTIKVIDSETCRPVRGAAVDI